MTACDSEHFLLAFNDIDKRFKKDKHVTMEHFYRAMRKQFDILMDDDKPHGGQWNFDANNRNKFSKSDLADIPKPKLFKNDVNIQKLIVEKGKKFQLSLCGMHAMDIMRMESGFLHWGHDISPEENQYQSGLTFTISNKKDINFIGKEALQKIKSKKIDRKFIMLTLKDNKPGSPLLLHDEPIYFKDKIIGRTTCLLYTSPSPRDS